MPIRESDFLNVPKHLAKKHTLIRGFKNNYTHFDTYTRRCDGRNHDDPKLNYKVFIRLRSRYKFDFSNQFNLYLKKIHFTITYIYDAYLCIVCIFFCPVAGCCLVIFHFDDFYSLRCYAHVAYCLFDPILIAFAVGTFSKMGIELL